MRISTSTCCHATVLRGKEKGFTCEQALDALKQAGYRYIDMNLCALTRGEGALTQPDWLDWCRRVRAYADARDLKLTQAHAHFFDPAGGVISERDAEMIDRSIAAAGILGAEWMVFHPYSFDQNGWYSYVESKRRNVALFTGYAEQCAKVGVGIAIENMIERNNRTRRYCTAAEELIELHDLLNDPIFGICWDFGHANLNKVDQCASLRMIGKRLKAVHVADNFGEKDDHVTPYFGNIDWAPIMKTLVEIGYTGDFTYEDFAFHHGLPADLRDTILKFTYELARYLIALGGATPEE